MKLISMTDYVVHCRKRNDLDNVRRFWACERYAQFLKTPLDLGMFVPCDENGNVLEEPISTYYTPEFGIQKHPQECFEEDLNAYNKAKERVIFEGWVCISEWYGGHLIARDLEGTDQFCTLDYDNIEQFIRDYNTTLTQNAIKKYRI